MLDVAGYTFPSNRAAIVCRHVWDGQPIRVFAHDDDGDIQFYCGSDGHSVADALVLGLAEIAERLKSMSDVPTVMPGYYAERSAVGRAWTVHKIDE